MKQYIIILLIPALLMCARVSAAGEDRAQSPDNMVSRHMHKQREVLEQYAILSKALLAPAEEFDAFRTFTLKNPNYFINSYSRSKTAHVITNLLKDNPEYLKKFRRCGLSQGGEYFCRKPDCPIHQPQRKGSVIIQKEKSPLQYVSAIRAFLYVLSGIMLFVISTALGRRIYCRREEEE